MPIQVLNITNFRNIAAARLKFATRLNVIWGNNGSGKTSLLEAIYYLSMGKSFRSANATRLIRHRSDKFSLFAHIQAESRQIPLGVERDLNGASQTRMAEKDMMSASELASLLPVRLINTQSNQMLEQGPLFRRRYLDWGVFYQTPAFFLCWRHFERALKQRNAALRNRSSKQEIAGWTEEVVRYGLALTQLREDYIQKLAPLLLICASELMDLSEVTLNYQPGWNPIKDYAAIMASAYEEDRRLGYTQYGPHRADLNILINRLPAKHFLSRGQQKLLICAMILAQGKFITENSNKDLIYLIDDLPSELDFNSKKNLISLLLKQPTQIFMSTIKSSSLLDFIKPTEMTMKMFHVEQGCVSQIEDHEVGV